MNIHDLFRYEETHINPDLRAATEGYVQIQKIRFYPV